MTVIRATSIILAVVVLFSGFLVGAGCASQRQARFDAAMASEAPPPDFWISVAVVKAPADTGSRAAAYLRMPAARRPARYIVEADRVLRAAVGSGSAEETFPTETRRLTQAEFDSIWNQLRRSPLTAAEHPARVGRAPTPSSVGAATVYVVSYSAGGDRRTLAIEVEPNAGPNAAEAGKLVEHLAGLAWMK